MAIDTRISWILNGQITHVLPDVGSAGASDLELMSRKGAIKIIETPDGVEFRWVLFSANWASVYFLTEMLHLYDGPFTLRYFLSGWFTEKIADGAAAKNRINQLIAKSDVHLGQHTFVKEGDQQSEKVPHILRDTLSDGTAIPELSVDCIFDDDSGKFLVQRVGSQSGIAKLWGVSPVSIPCLTGNSYDDMISYAYNKVLTEEMPHYDHVIAAMVLPNQSVNWVPYQRVILPHQFPNGEKGVSVVSEFADVDIKIV